MKEYHLKVPDYCKLKVAVLGDVMLDRYWEGAVKRISPEAPVPVLSVGSQRDALGGAANVARNIVASGAQCCLLGAVGDDAAGEALRVMVTEIGIEDNLLPALSQTTLKVRIVGGKQQLIRADFEDKVEDASGNLDQLDARLLQQLKSLLPQLDVLILSDYAKGVLRNPQPYIQAARDAGVPVLVDPKIMNPEVYSGATVLTPNWLEYTTMLGLPDSANFDLKLAQKMRVEANLQALLVTRGKLGMSLVTDDGVETIKTKAREVFDVTGAGDTVIAFMALGVASGQVLADACFLANMAAGIVVSKLGAATVSVSELRHALQQSLDPGSAVVNLEQCKMMLDQERERGNRIVFTNGCFDLLHPGHVRYLEQARQLGDRLVVGVNDDKSVQRLKGSPRPMNPLDARMACLAGLRAVDWVLPFSEDTPLQLIEYLQPDILVKGGDYKVEDVVGGDFVTSRGGEVKTLPFVEGFSTTVLIDRIREGEDK